MAPRQAAPGVRAAIDFGISNTDAVALAGGEWTRWTQPYIGTPDGAVVRSVLEQGGIALTDLPFLAATGGRHRLLPAEIDGVPVVAIHELQAIGRGG